MCGFCCNRNIHNGRVWRFDMLRKRFTRIVVSSHAKKESKFVLFTFLLCLSLGSPLTSVFRSSLTTFSFSCSSSGWHVLSVFALAVFRAVSASSSASFNRSSSSSRKAWSLLGYDLPLRSFFLLFYFILRFHSILVLLLRQSRSDFSSVLSLFEFELSVFF